MKILYLASSTPKLESLELEREITGIQRRLEATSNEQARFVFLPQVTFEAFALEVNKHRPDILHISAHGAESGLWFATELAEHSVELQAEALLAILPRDHLPKLVLLNACDSDHIAKRLATLPLVAIGTSAPITNQAAIASAGTLYDRLLSGATIAEAYCAMNAVVATLDMGQTRLSIFPEDGPLPGRVLYRMPHIVARLPSNARIFRKSGINAEIGFIGCPESTTQIVFFTDDPSFIRAKGSLEEDLTEVIRDISRDGEIWTETAWQADGDCRISACGITGSGMTFAASSKLSDALERYVETTPAPKAYLEILPKVLAFLRDRRGAGLADWVAEGSQER